MKSIGIAKTAGLLVPLLILAAAACGPAASTPPPETPGAGQQRFPTATLRPTATAIPTFTPGPPATPTPTPRRPKATPVQRIIPPPPPPPTQAPTSAPAETPAPAPEPEPTPAPTSETPPTATPRPEPVPGPEMDKFCKAVIRDCAYTAHMDVMAATLRPDVPDGVKQELAQLVGGTLAEGITGSGKIIIRLPCPEESVHAREETISRAYRKLRDDPRVESLEPHVTQRTEEPDPTAPAAPTPPAAMDAECRFTPENGGFTTHLNIILVELLPDSPEETAQQLAAAAGGTIADEYAAPGNAAIRIPCPGAGPEERQKTIDRAYRILEQHPQTLAATPHVTLNEE